VRRVSLMTRIVVFCMMTMFITIYSASASAGATEEASKEMVVKSYKNLAKVKSYHMTVDAVRYQFFQEKSIKIVIKSECDVQIKPMVYKSTTDMVMEVEGRGLQVRELQYMEEIDGQRIVYSAQDNRWFKQIIPRYSPFDDYDAYFKEIKSVKRINETVREVLFEVKVNGSYLRDKLNKRLGSASPQKAELDNELLSLGDFTYQVTIDKKSMLVSKLNIDMSEFLAKRGSTITESNQVPENQKDMIKEMFSNMKVSTTIAFSQWDSIGKIIIPDAAKNAPLISM
jgi:hypothetical protein